MWEESITHLVTKGHMLPRLLSTSWRKESGARISGDRPLDRDKVQAPCIVADPSGGFRLFYTALGPAKPFPACQGYILSAFSDDGLVFHKDPGIRLTPQPELSALSLRVLAPSVTSYGAGCWRMYFEARGPADQPTAICSAVSTDLLQWMLEEGLRLQSSGGVGGPRYCRLPDGRGRLYCFMSAFDADGIDGGNLISHSVISAVTVDGLHFDMEPGYRLTDGQGVYDAKGITAAEVIPPVEAGDTWTMVYSSWQDIPTGAAAPVHPSHDPDAVRSGRSEDFAATSIAADMAGYRSRIFVAHSTDGLSWDRGPCLVEGGGYASDNIDAVHAEDMSLVRIGPDAYRMYYAACNRHGQWQIASAVHGL